jgi:hypothetical protein
MVLLSLFPSLLTTYNTTLISPLSSLPATIKPTLLQHALVRRHLAVYASHLVACARVIAGRKLRWKRDTRLAQSMRIGPAAAGGTRGMKLASLDKSESNKEDREVAEVLRLWRLHAGRARGVLAAAREAGGGADDQGLPLQLPELRETAPVRVLKESEGGVAAPMPCVVCGLKRNERLHKVDVDVWDGFGEWWVEQASSHVGMLSHSLSFSSSLGSTIRILC